WGLLAILVACVANLFDNLIQLVNIIGSIFYGNILGVFLIAFFIKFVKGRATFIAAVINQLLVILLYYLDKIETIDLPYLWLNFVGCVSAIYIAILIQGVTGVVRGEEGATTRLIKIVLIILGSLLFFTRMLFKLDIL
ncbi:MAG: hypothetical protein AAF466_11025, partial [Bacteroidota bacterium]